MSTVLVVAGLVFVALVSLKLALTATRQLRYQLSVRRHQRPITEWEARQNAAPLTSAIIHGVTPHDRGDD
jgi:hypothetical protein